MSALGLAPALAAAGGSLDGLRAALAPDGPAATAATSSTTTAAPTAAGATSTTTTTTTTAASAAGGATADSDGADPGTPATPYAGQAALAREPPAPARRWRGAGAGAALGAGLALAAVLAARGRRAAQTLPREATNEPDEKGEERSPSVCSTASGGSEERSPSICSTASGGSAGGVLTAYGFAPAESPRAATVTGADRRLCGTLCEGARPDRRLAPLRGMLGWLSARCRGVPTCGEKKYENVSPLSIVFFRRPEEKVLTTLIN